MGKVVGEVVCLIHCISNLLGGFRLQQSLKMEQKNHLYHKKKHASNLSHVVYISMLILFASLFLLVFRVSNLLVEHSPVGSGAYRSVGEWLEAIKMGRYTEIFMENGYSSMDAVAQVTLE